MPGLSVLASSGAHSVSLHGWNYMCTLHAQHSYIQMYMYEYTHMQVTMYVYMYVHVYSPGGECGFPKTESDC